MDVIYIEDTQKRAYITVLGETGSPSKAAKAAHITQRVVQSWRENDEDFLIQSDDAMESLIDGLEEVAFQRAREGSDRLVEFLLKSNRPHKYRERMQIDIDSRTMVILKDLTGTQEQREGETLEEKHLRLRHDMSPGTSPLEDV